MKKFLFYLLVLNCKNKITLKNKDKGKNELIKSIVEKIKNKNESASLLHSAVLNEDIDQIKFILSNSSRPDLIINIKDECKYTPLHYAIKQNNTGIIKLMLNYKIDIESEDKDGINIIEYSFEQSNIENLKVILENFILKGININNFLYLAVCRENEILKCLLKYNLNPNVQDEELNTPLHTAVEEGVRKSIRILIEEYKANINIQNKEGYTPLHIAVKLNDETITDELTSYGANVNIKDKNGNTPFMIALFNNKDYLIKHLLKNNPTLDIVVKKDLNKPTLLHLIAIIENENILKKILKYLIKENKVELLNTRDINGATPLHYAIVNKDIKNVEMLLQANANPAIEDNNGNNALNYALEINEPKIIKLLLSYEVDKKNISYLVSLIANNEKRYVIPVNLNFTIHNLKNLIA